jgi:thiol-disulfide isomerase/thioredoxin
MSFPFHDEHRGWHRARDRPRRRLCGGNRSLPPALFVGHLLAVLALLLAGCGSEPPPAAPAALGSAPLIDRTAGQLDADLAGLHGRVVVLNFWASWCGPCKEEMPTIQRVAGDYAGRPVTVIGVDAGDVRSDAAAFLTRTGVTFPTVFDPKGLQGGIASQWSVTGLPQTWFLAPDGSRAGRHAGAIPEAELRRRIDELLPS